MKCRRYLKIATVTLFFLVINNRAISQTIDKLIAIRYDFKFITKIPQQPAPAEVNVFTNIYSLNDVILYQTPIFSADADDGVATPEIGISDRVFNYKFFIYKKSAAYGLLYKEMLDKSPVKIAVQDYEAEIFSFNEQMILSDNDILDRKYDVDSNTFKEEYHPKIKYDESYNDLSLLTFKRTFPEINFSISAKLEAERGGEVNCR